MESDLKTKTLDSDSKSEFDLDLKISDSAGVSDGHFLCKNKEKPDSRLSLSLAVDEVKTGLLVHLFLANLSDDWTSFEVHFTSDWNQGQKIKIVMANGKNGIEGVCNFPSTCSVLCKYSVTRQCRRFIWNGMLSIAIVLMPK
jgi:hypothetical protein